MPRNREQTMKATAGVYAVLLFGSLLLGSSGCAFLAGAAAGAATYAYVEGASRAAYPVGFDRTWQEAQAMVEAQGVAVKEQYRENGNATIKGLLADGKDVTVSLDAEGPEVTNVAIRVGTVPDQEAAENLQRALARRLGVKLPT
jgi:Protein of unknown function (DUF3568)